MGALCVVHMRQRLFDRAFPSGFKKMLENLRSLAERLSPKLQYRRQNEYSLFDRAFPSRWFNLLFVSKRWLGTQHQDSHVDFVYIDRVPAAYVCVCQVHRRTCETCPRGWRELVRARKTQTPENAKAPCVNS